MPIACENVNSIPSAYSQNVAWELFNCLHPCPCGYYWDSQKPYSCAHALVTEYQKQISGPLLDRIDIQIEVPRVDYEKLSVDRIRSPITNV